MKIDWGIAGPVVVMTVGGLMLVNCLIMFNRNNSVYDFRTKIIDRTYYMIREDKNKGLDPSWREREMAFEAPYGEMMAKWWIPLDTQHWFTKDPTQ